MTIPFPLHAIFPMVLEQMQTGVVVAEIHFDRDSALPRAQYPVVVANTAFVQMFGYSSVDEVCGRDVRSFIQAENAESFEDIMQLGIPQTLVLGLQSQDGSAFHAHVQMALISADISHPTHIICTFTDITDLIETNEELLRQKEELQAHIATRTKELQEFIDEMRNELHERRLLEIELRSAEARYRSLAKNFPNGAVILLARDYSCLLCEGTLVGAIPLERAADGRIMLSAALLEKAESSIQTAFEGKQASFEFSLHLQPFLAHAVPMQDDNGQIDAVMLVLQDISDFKARQELEQEREMTALKYRFVTIASHELRTPLAGLMLSSGMLRRYWTQSSDEEKLASLSEIMNGLNRMRELIDDILLVGKSEAGKLPFEPQEIDLAALCSEMITECEKGIGSRHTTERQMPPDGKVRIYADAKLLHLIINNLLSNAYKYSPPGSRVVFSLQCNAAECKIQVQDTGIGIPAEDIPNLFKSFHRGRNVGEIQGTGLGLALVERAVEQHGGSIQVRSVEHEGTIFEIILPLALPHKQHSME